MGRQNLRRMPSAHPTPAGGACQTNSGMANGSADPPGEPRSDARCTVDARRASAGSHKTFARRESLARIDANSFAGWTLRSTLPRNGPPFSQGGAARRFRVSSSEFRVSGYGSWLLAPDSLPSGPETSPLFLLVYFCNYLAGRGLELFGRPKMARVSGQKRENRGGPAGNSLTRGVDHRPMTLHETHNQIAKDVSAQQRACQKGRSPAGSSRLCNCCAISVVLYTSQLPPPAHA